MKIEVESGIFEIPEDGGYFLAGNIVLCALIGGSSPIRGGYGDVVEGGISEEWKLVLSESCPWDKDAVIEVFKVCVLPEVFAISQYAI